MTTAQPFVRPATAADLGAIQALLQRAVILPDAAATPHERLLVVVRSAADDGDGDGDGDDDSDNGSRVGRDIDNDSDSDSDSANDSANDTSAGRQTVLATLRLRPAIGLDRPHVSYHVGCTVHAAAELGLFHRQRTLLLGHDHTGASELADIAWLQQGAPLAEQAAALRLGVRAALLAVAMQRRAYAATLVAELPGPRDSAGQSPFWHGLGRRFYAGDPQAAAQQHGPAWRSLVAALLPRQPVYASFLPSAAATAIGQVAPAAALLADVLEDAGLRYSHHVNVEDGGPVLEAMLDDLPGVATARRWTLAADAPPPGAPAMLLGTTGATRALRGAAQAMPGPHGKLRVALATRQRLGGLLPGDTVWAADCALPSGAQGSPA